jgi:hypothetical protein
MIVSDNIESSPKNTTNINIIDKFVVENIVFDGPFDNTTNKSPTTSYKSEVDKN